MDYLDFEVEIGVGSGRAYPVTVIRSASGEARETMHFPFDELALENQLLSLQNALLRSGGKRRQIFHPEEQTVQNFGRALFNALFTGEVGKRYAVSQLAASNQGKGLRLKLRIRSPELAALPWEFLYDPDGSEFICLSSATPIVRYLELAQPPRPLLVTPPLSILAMTSSPKDLPELEIEREKLRLEKAVADLRAKGLVELTWLPGQGWYDLQKAMRHGPWHIFHFIGHGGFDTRTDEGLIALEDEDGKARLLSATQMGLLLADHRFLRLVVLNSCEGAKGSEHDIFSGTASILVRRGIPAVLAMQYEITDRAAIEFSRAFYDALADGSPVDTAVSEARKAINLGIANTLEWGTPVLYMRSPDGVLFEIKPKPFKQQEPADRTDAEQVPLVDTVSPFGTHLSEIPLLEEHSRVTSEMPEQAEQSADETSPAVQTSVQSDSPTLVHLEATPSSTTTKNKEFILVNTLTGHLKNTVKSVALLGRSSSVLSVAISPDGQTLVSGAADETIKVWNLHSGALLHTITGHSSLVTSVTISPNGQMLVSGSWDNTIKVWNLHSGALLRTITGHSRTFLMSVNSVAISPDGQTLVSGGHDKMIKVWNLENRELLRTLTGHSSSVRSVAISPDGQMLVSGSDDKTIKVWSLHGVELLRTLTGHSNYVTSVAISPDGQMLVSGSDDKTIKVWSKK